MIPLNANQMTELTEFLGHDPSIDGEWSITTSPNNGPCIYAINSKGTIVVRLTCVDKAGRTQKPRLSYIREYPDHYLFCNLNNKDIRLHRLMAYVWLDDWDETLTVNHKDGNKHNNDYHNLEMMTVHDNCMHYHNSEEIAEKRKKDYAHHGETIKGRIHITDGVSARMIHPEEGIPEGWWQGRPQSMRQHISNSQKGKTAHNLGKIMITNGVNIQYIDKSDNVPEGWRKGGCDFLSAESKANLSAKMKGRTYIHRGSENRRVYSNEISKYLSEGWELGLYMKQWDRSSPEYSEARRDNMRQLMTGSGNPMYGKHLSAEHKAKLAAANKNRIVSEDTRKKISKSKIGYHHTEAARKKMSDAMKGKQASNKGYVWITDGSNNKQIPESELGDYPEYRKGITRDKIERVYVNDGVTNYKIPVVNLAEWLDKGYVKGLIRKKSAPNGCRS